MDLLKTAASSSIASTSTSGAFSSTRWPDSSDSEPAVRANAILISSPKECVCLSVNNTSALLQGRVHSGDDFTFYKWLGYKAHSAFSLRHCSSRYLYVRSCNDHAGLTVQLADSLQNLHSEHAFHDQIQQYDIRPLEIVLFDGDHSIFGFGHVMTRSFQDSAENSARHGGVINDQDFRHTRPPRLHQPFVPMEWCDSRAQPRSPSEAY